MKAAQSAQKLYATVVKIIIRSYHPNFVFS